jgi:murein DD-endopeptidase MepM/ murein hydrolase activator NlpD
VAYRSSIPNMDHFAPRCVNGTYSILAFIVAGLLWSNVIYYYHLHKDDILLQLAEVIVLHVKDTVVGYVGNTGKASTTPPHLHFGVYTREGAINPYPLLIER